MSEGDYGVFFLVACCASRSIGCSMGACKRCHSDNKRVEVLFRNHSGSLFEFELEKTSVQRAHSEQNCYDCCCCHCCCDEGTGITTSSRVASVTQGGFAESLGVQVGWGLEKIGEMEVHDLQISSVRQIMQMAQLPVVLTFMLPRGEETKREANPANVTANSPLHLEISRYDKSNQTGSLVKVG